MKSIMSYLIFFRFGRLNEELEEVVSQMETGTVVLADLEDDLRSAANDLAELEDELDDMGPIGRDTDTVHSQIGDIMSFNGKLYEKQDMIDDLKKKADELVKDGILSSSDPRYTQMETLVKQHAKLGTNADNRHDQLKQMMDKLEGLQDEIRDCSNDIEKLKDLVADRSTPAGDIKAIKEQQETFRNLNKNELEPIQKRVDTINKQGQGLMQSAAPGVSTSTLEADLEMLNDKWTDLNERVSNTTFFLYVHV